MDFANLENILKTSLLLLSDSIVSDMNSNNSNSSSKLASSLTVDTFGTAELVGGSLSGEDYWKFFDKGRKPGKMPPISPIEKWVKNKGIDVSAWAIAKSIAKKGTKGTNIFTDNIDRFEKELEKSAFDALFKDLDSELDKIIKDANNTKV